MALSNQQYESIMKGYEQAQMRNHRILSGRREEIYAHLPEYRDLELAVGSVSVSFGRRMLDGEPGAREGLHKALASLSRRKCELLKSAGYPEDYLEPVYSCPDCLDTGYRNGEKCHCFRQQEITLLYEQSNIREMIAKENFSTLSYEYYKGDDLNRFQSAAQACEKFIQNFDMDYHNLFFYGTVGTGKSFLSGCIAKELLEQGHSVIYFSSSGLFDTLARYSFDIKLKETLYNFYKDLYNCDLVIIDDLGTEVTNTFVTSQLFACLNERHLRKKATIISTNLNLEELRDRYSDRIFSRITSNYQIYKLSGPDIRMYKKMTSRKRRQAFDDL